MHLDIGESFLNKIFTEKNLLPELLVNAKSSFLNLLLSIAALKTIKFFAYFPAFKIPKSFTFGVRLREFQHRFCESEALSNTK